MRFLEYKEIRAHRTQGFPFAFYHVTPAHPRYHMLYHWHPEYELIRVLQGGIQMRLDGNTVSASAGDVLLVTDGVLHGGASQDCVYECIVFDLQAIFPPALCDEDMLAILQHKNTLQSVLTPHAVACAHLHGMFGAMAARQKGYRHQVLGALHGFLGEAINQGLYETPAPGEGRGHKQMMRLKNALEMIRSNYHEDLTLAAIADCAEMNQKYFCRYFRSVMDKTPMDYLNYYRIECACEQITLSGKNITDIAMDCGFNDSSYFVKVFKRYKGMTPTQYARQAQA